MRLDAPPLDGQGDVDKVLVQLEVPQRLHNVRLVVVPLQAVMLAARHRDTQKMPSKLHKFHVKTHTL